MTAQICAKMCKECPFSSRSLPGWLADYDVADFANYMKHDIWFPCHMLVEDDSVEPFKLKHIIQSGRLKLCRGYVEMMARSAHLPRDSELAAFVQQVKDVGLSDESMSFWDFTAHHSKVNLK